MYDIGSVSFRNEADIMEYIIGKIRLDIDPDKTRELCGSSPALTETCDCSACRNFAAAAPKADKTVLGFFEGLGLDITKPAEIYSYPSGDGGSTVNYEGFWHICGSMLSDTDCWKDELREDPSTRLQTINEASCFQVTPELRVGFTEHISLSPDGFPGPVLQMEAFFSRVPWVIGEPEPCP